MPTTVRVRALDVGLDLVLTMQPRVGRIVRGRGQQAGRLMVLHAAAVADPGAGRAIALVGAACAGKTTATQLVAQEYGYLGDQQVGVRADGTIDPHPKPLSIIRDNAAHTEQVDTDAVGLLNAPPVAYVATIAVLDRDLTEPTAVQTVSSVEALSLLSAQTSYLSRHDGPVHRLTDIVERAGGPRVIRYADRGSLRRHRADGP